MRIAIKPPPTTSLVEARLVVAIVNAHRVALAAQARAEHTERMFLALCEMLASPERVPKDFTLSQEAQDNHVLAGLRQYLADSFPDYTVDLDLEKEPL